MSSTTPQKKITSKVVSKMSIKSRHQRVQSSDEPKQVLSSASTLTSMTQLSSSSTSKTLSPVNTDKKKLPVKSIGMVLKQVRESKSIKVIEISRRLRISERYLHGIESMDAASLPEKVYALGFVRSYAQHLGVDPEKSLQQFKLEIYNAKPFASDCFNSEKKLRCPMPVDRTHMPSAKIMIFSALVVFSFLVIWAYLNQQKSSNFIIEDEIANLLSRSSDIIPETKPSITPSPILSFIPSTPTSSSPLLLRPKEMIFTKAPMSFQKKKLLLE